MGRRDAVQFTLELAAEWRRLGATVLFRAGWETRGNGTSANYEGGNVHHTGFGSSEANPTPGITTLEKGRPDLGPPLCNSAGPWCPPDQPTIVIVAAHPANHAGASGGKAMGPMPVTSLFNPRSWGHEIDYGGNVPMAPGQLTAALIVAKGLANVLKRSTEYVRAHAETSVTGKWDPGYAPGKTIDMGAFRRDAAAYTPSAIAPQEDDDMAKYPLFLQAPNRPIALVWPGFVHVIANDEELRRANSRFGDFEPVGTREWDVDVALHVNVAMSQQAVEDIAAGVAKTAKNA